MKLKFKMAYFRSIYDRYHKASKRIKQKILDEFCKICRYNRKYAIYKLNGSSPEDRIYALRKKRARKRKPTIYSNKVIELLSKVWEAAGYPCGVRLKAIVPLWMRWIEKHFHPSDDDKQKLLEISPSQADRRLRPKKLMVKKRIYGRTKPGRLLKHHIPIKTDHWDVKVPGFTEVDTVSHSGNSGSGEFAYSVNQTDILTAWVETRAVLGKGEKGVSQALEEMKSYFPFKILGIDSDNGNEFINYHLYNICKKQDIQFTRGREYKKDDNAHIEQKNFTHVRKIMGWNRYDTPEAVDAMNDLYRNELHLFMNLFMPSQKIQKKKQLGSKRKRYHDKPMTPLDRVIASGKGDPVKIEYYKKLREQLDPFELSKTIDRKLENIFELANYRHSPKPVPLPQKPKEKKKPKTTSKRGDAFEVLSRIFEMPISVAK